MRFLDPQWLVLLLLLVPWTLWHRRREGSGSASPMADAGQIAALPETPRVRAYRLLPLMRMSVLVLIIVALARPQTIKHESTIASEGVDLVAVLDLSTSMLAEDRQANGAATHDTGKNRLGMAKEVLVDFLHGRPGDRIGLIAFAARAYPAAPLTVDHAWLQTVVTRLQAGSVEDGTALGDALLAALNRLRAQPATDPAGPTAVEAQGQAIIVITDGRSNAGTATPQVAAMAAKALGIRIHTIGIGSHGQAVIPMVDPLGNTRYRRVEADLDEATLREVASISGGSYFRADDRDVLAKVFRDIDRLEKRPMEQKIHFAYQEQFPPLLVAALAIALVELMLRATLLRKLP